MDRTGYFQQLDELEPKQSRSHGDDGYSLIASVSRGDIDSSVQPVVPPGGERGK